VTDPVKMTLTALITLVFLGGGLAGCRTDRDEDQESGRPEQSFELRVRDGIHKHPPALRERKS